MARGCHVPIESPLVPQADVLLEVLVRPRLLDALEDLLVRAVGVTGTERVGGAGTVGLADVEADIARGREADVALGCSRVRDRCDDDPRAEAHSQGQKENDELAFHSPPPLPL